MKGKANEKSLYEILSESGDNRNESRFGLGGIDPSFTFEGDKFSVSGKTGGRYVAASV